VRAFSFSKITLCFNLSRRVDGRKIGARLSQAAADSVSCQDYFTLGFCNMTASLSCSSNSGRQNTVVSILFRSSIPGRIKSSEIRLLVLCVVKSCTAGAFLMGRRCLSK
jgi:hypothetical protein